MAVAQLLQLMVAVLAVSKSVLEISVEDALFQSFVFNYSKSYRDDPEVMAQKFKIFQQSLARQKLLNEYERDHQGTAVYGINRFSDLTPEEFKATYFSPARPLPLRRKTQGGSFGSRGESKFSNTSVDWRTKDVIGPIRNQDQCGSCWAFAVVETIESVYAIERGQKLDFILSSQQLISCDSANGLNGCKGGVLKVAFDSLEKGQTVVVSEEAYPFTSSSGNDPSCAYPSNKPGLILTNYSYYSNADVDQMTMMVQEGPVTTSVNAVPWQDYIGGIVQHHCTNSYIDHAVQVVGYDLTGEVPYWVVRNTWGEGWGEHGYIKLLYGENMCGIRDEVATVHNVISSGF